MKIKFGQDRVLTSQEIGRRFSILRTALALLLAMGIAILLIFLVSNNPFRDINSLLLGPLSSSNRISQMVNKWIPLLFTGTAVCLFFSVGQINLAAEGAFFAGAFTSTLVAIIGGIPPGLHFILCALAGGLAGAIVCGLPGIMYTKFNVLTVVSSLMINYVVLYLGLFIITNVVRDPAAGYEASYRFKNTARLAELIPGTNVHTGLIIGVLVVVFGYLLLYKSTFGLQIRTIGANAAFARYSGMPVAKVIVLSQLLGGFIAGLGGTTEVLGLYNRFGYTGLTNHGWDGIMLAVLARNNPKYIPLAALFLAYLRTSADVLNLTSNVPSEVINIIQAIIISFIAAERFLAGWEYRTIVKNTEKAMSLKEGVANE